MGDMSRIKIDLNGRRHLLDVGSNTTLLDLLRDTIHLYGSKECCGVGECGACTVLVDGRTANSCARSGYHSQPDQRANGERPSAASALWNSHKSKSDNTQG